MLLFDLSGIIIHTCINLHHESKEEVTCDVVRHVAFSSLLYYKRKFKDYGTPIICVDSKPYWRESIHEYYKKNRKKSQDKSGIDWKEFNKNFASVIEDINEYSPYHVLRIPRCEADDIIAVLAQYAHARNEKVMIISSDKDLIQLQNKYKGTVKQFSPNRKKLLTSKEVEYDLVEHVLKGDSTDGIPNVLSKPDHYMDDESGRAKPVTKKFIQSVKDSVDGNKLWESELFDEDVSRRVKQNQFLIDLTFIPDKIKERVISAYEEVKDQRKPNKMMSCVRKYRLRNLVDSIHDF